MIAMILAAGIAGAQTASAADIQPLAPALAGKAQCYAPDAARKTCKSMAYYAARSDGGYDNRGLVLLQATPPVVLDTVTPVTVKDGAVCGAIRAQDIAAGKLIVQGQTLPDAAAKPWLDKITASLSGVIGHEICTRYVDDGKGGLIAQASMDGQRQTDQDQAMTWVASEDGYTVAP